MSVREPLVNEFMNIAIEELTETGTPVTPENHHLVLQDWCNEYDEVPPCNRAEVAVRDALEEARARVARHNVPHLNNR